MNNQKQPSKKWTLKDTNKNGKPSIYTWAVDTKATNEYRARRRAELKEQHPEWTTAEINEQIYKREASVKKWICLGRYDGGFDFDTLSEKLPLDGLSVDEKKEELERILNEIEDNKEEIEQEAEQMRIHAGHYKEALKELMEVEGMPIKDARTVLTERRKNTGSYR